MVQDLLPVSTHSLALFSWSPLAQALSLAGPRLGQAAAVLVVSPFADALPAEAFVDGARIVRLEGIPHSTEGVLNLRRYSLDELRSLTAPTPLLHDLYPALHERASLQVSALPPQRVATELGALDQPVHAVFDMPGHEAVLLELLAEAGMIGMIEQLTLRTMQEVCFEGALGAPALIAMLEGLGFRLTQRDDSDPDWPVLTATADPATGTIAGLEAQVAELRQDSQTAAARLSELDAALKSRDATLAAMQEKLATATRAQAALDRALAESREATQAAAAERDAAKAELVDVRGQVQVAQRLQLMAVNDLKSLRERHEQAVQARSEMEDLLRKLVGRLKDAQTQLRDLVDEQRPVFLPPVQTAPEAVVASDVPRPARKKSKKARRKNKGRP